MSHVALQRAILRMMYDPALTKAVYRDSKSALAGAGLTNAEHDWLVAADQRAWAIDPYRRSRSLVALIEEYPVGSALAVRQNEASALDAFFSGPIFHEGMQDGRYLALDYGAYLGELAQGDALGTDAVTLEAAVARARRRLGSADSGDYRLAPQVGLVEVAVHSLREYARIHTALGQHPRGVLEAVIDESFQLGVTPAESSDVQPILVLFDSEAGDARLEPLSAELFQILDAARRGTSKQDLMDTCLAIGASHDEAESVIEGFLRTGEIVRST